MSKTFLWIEDRKDKSSYIFWQKLMEQLYPEIVVESKKHSSEGTCLIKQFKNIGMEVVL